MDHQDSQHDLHEASRYEPRRPSGTSGGQTVLIAIVSAIIGGIISSYIGPMYIYGRYLPYPPNYYVQYRLPPVSEERPTDLNLLPQMAATGPAEKVGPAVVGIINRVAVRDFFGQRTRLVERGSGSGAIFDDERGYIFTNHHVVEGAAELIVKLANGQLVPGELVGSDYFTDLAVVKIDPAHLRNDPNLSVIRFGDSTALRVGELAVAIGNPLGLDRTVTAGIISALNRAIQVDEEREMELLQTDAAINMGNSGGPLVNSQGQVIGINTIKLTVQGVEGMGFAIPVHLARPVLEDLINYGRVIRPYLGISGRVIDRSVSAQYDFPVDYGIYVQVTNGSPAQRAGIRDGDIIVALDGTRITSFESLRRILYRKRPGEVLQVTVVRINQELTVPVTLDELQQP